VLFANLQPNPEITTVQPEKLFLAVQADPFVVPSLLLESLLIAESVSKQKTGIAERVFKSLPKPFALYARDEQRVTSALICAQQLGTQPVAWVLEALEPNPIWSQVPLELRVNAYEQTRSLYLDSARRDLDLFMRDSPPAQLSLR